MTAAPTKRPRGRPALPAADRKEVVTLRLSPVQQARFRAAAKRDGLTLRQWIVVTLMDASYPPVRITNDPRDHMTDDEIAQYDREIAARTKARH